MAAIDMPSQHKPETTLPSRMATVGMAMNHMLPGELTLARKTDS